MTSESSRRRAWALLAPALVAGALWWVLPLVATTWSALGDLDAVVRGRGRDTLVNTVVWVVVAAVGSTAVGLALAWLAERLRATRLLVPFVVLPSIVAGSVVAVAWRSVLAFRPAGTSQVGLANLVLTLPGLDPVAWLTQVPNNPVLLAGPLVGVLPGVARGGPPPPIPRKVSPEVREAAVLDGATPFEVFRFVTLPSIRGAVVIAAVTSAAAAVKVFDLVVVATDGLHTTQVLGTESIRQSLGGGDAGVGAALALAMVILLAPLALWSVSRASRRPGVEEPAS